MSLLTAENLQLRFGPKTILDGAGFMISAGERIGLVGPNGTGKSTLLRVIVGKQALDGGRLHKTKGLTLGYLSQDVLEFGEGRLLETVLAAVPGKKNLEERLLLAEEELRDSHDPEEQMELAQRLADLHEQVDRFEADYSRHEAESILVGLGFDVGDFQRPLTEFSGGWKMRAALAGILFKRPDLLLLDEPTNHLDVPSVTWLNEFLLQVKNAIVLISHDADILNRQVRRILSFEVEGLRSYSGNYRQYKELRENELEVRRAARRNQDAEIRQTEQFVRRFRAKSTKAKQVQSRLRKIEKIELVEVDFERPMLKFTFPPTDRIGKLAIELNNISHAFGELKLYENLNLSVARGDRVALIGKNGAGKTTLLRIMSGDLTPVAGVVEYGANVEMSYYAQHHSDRLVRTRSVLDEVWSTNPSLTNTQVRNICGSFLFTRDEVDKPIGVLSGGELARVSLAKLLVRPGNVLLMDEPTNHLDLMSSEALAETLETYDGTLVFVSHNRSLINRIANKIWDLEHGHLEVFPGNLDEYLYHLRVRDRREAPAALQETKTIDRLSPAPERRREPKAQYEERKKLQRERRQIERGIEELNAKAEKLEERIAGLEKRKKELEDDLARPATYDDAARYNRLLEEYRKTEDKIGELTVRWEFTHEEIDKQRGKLDAVPDP